MNLRSCVAAGGLLVAVISACAPTSEPTPALPEPAASTPSSEATPEAAASKPSSRPPEVAVTAAPTKLGRASHVLVLNLTSVSAQPWTREGRTKSREVTFDAIVTSVMKGDLEEKATGAITVSQHAPATSRVFAVPGVWSPVSLTPGQALLIVSNDPSSDLPAVLAETSVVHVFPAATAHADAVLALDIEARQLDLAATCDALRTAPQIATAGPLLIEFVGERLQAFDARDAAGVPPLQACLQWLETPAVATPLQTHAINVLIQRLLLIDASAQLRALVALTGLRLVRRDPQTPLAGNLAQTLLPNLLGLTGAATPVTPDEVFVSAPTERQATTEVLRDASKPSFEALRAWIE